MRRIVDAIEQFEDELGCTLDAAPLESLLTAYATLEEANRLLAQLRTLVRNAATAAMDDKVVTVEGVGTFTKHGKRDRKTWDSAALLSAVLDSRLVNTATGEVADESPLDKVLATWNLGVPRVKHLRERGIDPDEFCESTWGGWTLEVQS
jgi:hypothetical protein